LKKRSKKLLLRSPSPDGTRDVPVLHETDKSFLVLFFKKEHFFFACAKSMRSTPIHGS
jgi:hypothetical protein